MTQEEKFLLLQDLCARLPYKVKVLGPWKKDGPCELSAIDLISSRQIRVFEDWFSVEDVKPYLRPMSSMTKDEKHEFYDICTELSEDKNHFIMEGCIDSNYMLEKFNWLNAHHFDYRGLIEKGLALEAPEGMYDLKEK